MTEELPDLSDREIVQLMAAQRVVFENREELDEKYKEMIRSYAERYSVEVNV